MHEIIQCPKCREEKDFYLDDDGYCIYESKCQCDKKRIKDKKLDEALKLIGELIQRGEFSYAKQ
jgi:hypothetical protein